MGRKRLTQSLTAYMNGHLVGTLKRHSSGELNFTYDESWLNWENARPISLSMPLTEVPYRGDLVYNFFDNLLPDSEIIRNRIQARFGIPTGQCFDLLSYIGADCIGALQLLMDPSIANVKRIVTTPIDDPGIAALLKRYRQAPLGMDRHHDFRISIAGAQEKTALLWHDNQWHLPLQATPTSHIVKLPIGIIPHANMDLSDSVENEWLCLQILAAFGLPVNEAIISQFEDMKALVIKRFDRQWSENNSWLIRLPQEDMCQVLGTSSHLKYESDGGPGIIQIMNELRGSENPIASRTQFMKSVFLFWVMGAIDGHAKNFSIAIKSKGRFSLTPLYDVISAYPLTATRQLDHKALKMAMSVKSKNRHYSWAEIKLRHWLSMAKICQFPETDMRMIIGEIMDKLSSVIDTVSMQLPGNFPAHIADPIFAGMKQIRSQSVQMTNH